MEIGGARRRQRKRRERQDRTNGEQWIREGGSRRPWGSGVRENPIKCRGIEREREEERETEM
jgi:hypothetical protein